MRDILKNSIAVTLAMASVAVAINGEDTVAATIAIVALLVFEHKDKNKEK